MHTEMAKTKIWLVLHLGDYIYEYDEDGYATEDLSALIGW